MDAKTTEDQSTELMKPAALDERVPTAVAQSVAATGNPISVPIQAPDGLRNGAETDGIAEVESLQETAEDVGLQEEERRRNASGAGSFPPEAAADSVFEIIRSTHVVASSPVIDQIQDETAPAVPERADLEQKVEALEERLDRLEKALLAPQRDAINIGDPALPSQPLGQGLETNISQAREREAAGLVEDQKALAGHQQALSHWCDAAATLQQDIEATIEKATGALADATQAKNALLSVLQESLKGRHQGLELVGKMLTRLPEKVSALGCNSRNEVSLEPLAEPEWRQVVMGDVSGKKTEAKLRVLESERYQQVTQARDLADGQRKRLFGFIEKQLLPILDALDEGEKLSRPYRAIANKPESIPADPDSGEKLIRWFNTYSLIRADLLGIMAKLGIHPMTVTKGEMIDYTRHEPFDVVPDPEQPTEAVKEEIRKGYGCQLPSEQAPTVLRAAQVVVVKN